jgi:pyrroline-5-carboxylate reductase
MAPLVVIGGGRMGEALAAGLAATHEVLIVEASAGRRAELAAAHPHWAVAEEAPPGSEIIVAVKPAQVAAVCAALGPGRPARLLSIAAGVTTAAIEAALGVAVPVVRAMPNTPAVVGAGASAIAAGAHAGPDDLAWATRLLGAVGTVATVDEHLLDAVTGVSGSGPAYVFLLVEALIDGGVLVGLPRPVARELAVQTLLGAARLLSETGEPPEALRAAVTSPGGTTAAALRALERGGMRAAVIDAVTAATERAAALGRPAPPA